MSENQTFDEKTGYAPEILENGIRETSAEAETFDGETNGGGAEHDDVPENAGKPKESDAPAETINRHAGVGVIEIILILVVLVTLVLIFKNQLTKMVEDAFAALEKSMQRILQ